MSGMHDLETWQSKNLKQFGRRVAMFSRPLLVIPCLIGMLACKPNAPLEDVGRSGPVQEIAAASTAALVQSLLSDPRGTYRYDCAVELSRRPPKQVMDLLQPGLKTARFSRGVEIAMALHGNGDPRSLTLLHSLCRRTDPQERRTAYLALAKTRLPAEVSFAREKLQTDKVVAQTVEWSGDQLMTKVGTIHGQP